jgi:alkaline phosphatase D
VLDHLSDNAIDDVVFLTGDVHSSWAFDVPPPLSSQDSYDPLTGRGARAVEFVSPAVSSPALGSSPRAVEFFAGVQEIAPHLKFVNLEEHGFVILDLDRERARGEFVFTDSVRTRSNRYRCGPAFETLSGSNHLSQVDPGACLP